MVKHSLYSFWLNWTTCTQRFVRLWWTECEWATWCKLDTTGVSNIMLQTRIFSHLFARHAVSTLSPVGALTAVTVPANTQQACPVPRGHWIYPINMQTLTQCEPIIWKNIRQLWSPNDINLASWLQWFKVSSWTIVLRQSLQLQAVSVIITLICGENVGMNESRHHRDADMIRMCVYPVPHTHVSLYFIVLWISACVLSSCGFFRWWAF